MTDRVIGAGAHEWEKVALDPQAAANNVSVIAAPTTPGRLYLDSIIVSCDAAAVVKVSEGNDAVGTRLLYSQLGGAGQHGISFPSDRPKRMPVATALKVSVSAGNFAVTVYYATGE